MTPDTNKTSYFELDDERFIERDELIEMKCIKCGYEKAMPVFVYGEEADYLIDIGSNEKPCFNCPKCHKDSLYRKEG